MLIKTKRMIILLAMFVLSHHLFGLEEKWFINHIQTSILRGSKKYSKLIDKPEILELQGMSSRKIRHLLNNICDFEKCNYLEVG